MRTSNALCVLICRLNGFGYIYKQVNSSNSVPSIEYILNFDTLFAESVLLIYCIWSYSEECLKGPNILFSTSASRCGAYGPTRASHSV